MLNDLIEFKVVSNVYCVMLVDKIMDLLIVFLVLKNRCLQHQTQCRIIIRMKELEHLTPSTFQ